MKRDWILTHIVQPWQVTATTMDNTGIFCRWVADKNISQAAVEVDVPGLAAVFAQFQRFLIKLSEFIYTPDMGVREHKGIIKRSFLITWKKPKTYEIIWETGNFFSGGD